MAGGGLTIFNDGNFRIGLGDANNDGKLDFDFGLRSQSFGASPWGYASQGAELGLNTQRGAYLGTDYAAGNAFGQQSGYARFFGDGTQSGAQGSDIFGNYYGTHTNTGAHGYYNANQAGNVYTGNYAANQTSANWFGFSQDAVAGNAWTGQQVGQHSFFGPGGGGSYTSFNPGFVPTYAGSFYQGSGCGCAHRFFG